MDSDSIKNKIQAIFKCQVKPEQLETIASYCTGKDTILVAPTGFGKSLIYQSAPFLLDQDRYHTPEPASVPDLGCDEEDVEYVQDTSTPLRPSKGKAKSTSDSELDLSSMLADLSTDDRQTVVATPEDLPPSTSMIKVGKMD